MKEFCAYYDLYCKYKKDYRIEEILNGQASVQAISRAKAAPFDERLSLLGMLLDKILADMKECMEELSCLTQLQGSLKAVKAMAQEAYTEQVLGELDRLAQGEKSFWKI